MKSYIKSIIFLSCILVGGNYVFGVDQNKKMPEPKENITIIATYKIDEGHANEDVRIINDSKCASKNKRAGIDSIEIYKLCNNNEHQFEHIAGKDKNGEIDKKYNFITPGEYRIYYYFEEGITDMSYMFFRCSALQSLDLSNFNTQNVIDMAFMFYECSSLTSLNLNNFNTEMVTNMSCMFYGCSSLTTFNLSSFKTNSVTTMPYMFNGCSSLTSLNLSSFETNMVADMSEMFSGCTSLKTLDLSNFNTEKVGAKKDLFAKCSKLEEITTNDKHIKEWCETNNVNVLPTKKEDENIEIGDNQNLLKGDSQTQSNSNCWCCPCWKNR